MLTSAAKRILKNAILIAGIIIVPGCSKERTEPENDKTSYEEVDEYYDSKKQEEQEYEIDESGNGPLVGKQGTKIYPEKNKLMYTNGDSVQFPFTIKLVELYSPKDMLYWQMPTVSDGSLLTTGGELRIRAFKDDIELVLRPNMTWTVEMPSGSPENDMQIYYSLESGRSVDWTTNPAGVFNTTSYGYAGEIAKLGWVACGKNIQEPASVSTCSFVSETDNLDNTGIFMYFPVLKSLVQVYSQQSIDLPVGEDAKIVVTAINANEQLFSFYNEIQIGEMDEIEVKMDSVSDGQLNAILDAL